jgi:hypothetical protein
MSGKSIDDEFAELQKEIERVSALAPTVGASAGVMSLIQALQGLKAHWDQKLQQRFDGPKWRRKVDEAIGIALAKILQVGQSVDRQGNLGFHLGGDTLTKAAQPVVEAALGGLEQAFVDKWLPKPGEPQPQAQKKIEASDLGGILALLLRDKIKPSTKK